MSVLLLLIAAYIGIIALVFFVVWKLVKWFVDSIFTAGTATYALTQHRKTQQHYYDHEDKYYDYLNNQWYYKTL
jgi:uncharacterized protein HemY